MMTGILMIGCFLRHIIQSNLLCFNLSLLKCVVLMRYVIILIKLLCMYVPASNNEVMFFVCLFVCLQYYIY